MSQALRPSISGVAKVYCVHDREKRVVTDPEHVAYLGRVAGIPYDARRHKLHNCACCSNLFVADNDTPTLCHVCNGALRHKLEASLPDPEGAIE